MAMKISLALGSRDPLSRQTAWGCFTANLALPGCGSLLAGRISGYAQLTLGVAGVILTTVFGVRFIVWYVANWSRLNDPQSDDPFGPLGEIWQAVRWAALGMALFGVGWLWALITSIGIVQSAKRAESDKTPPRIN
jgi:hypothetical protein